MDATILVDNENKEWCLQNGIKKVTTENGRTKAYGKMNTRNYNWSHYRIPRTRCTTRKRHSREDKNNVVLGMPCLESEDPRMNWKEKLQLGKSVQKSRQARKGTEDEWENIRPSIWRINMKKNRKRRIVKRDDREDQGTPKAVLLGTWYQPDEERRRDQCDQDGTPSYEVFDHIQRWTNTELAGSKGETTQGTKWVHRRLLQEKQQSTCDSKIQMKGRSSSEIGDER